MNLSDVLDYSKLPDITGWNIKQLNDFIQRSNLTFRIYGSGMYVDNFDVEESPDGTIVNIQLSSTPKITKSN